MGSKVNVTVQAISHRRKIWSDYPDVGKLVQLLKFNSTLEIPPETSLFVETRTTYLFIWLPTRTITYIDKSKDCIRVQIHVIENGYS